MVYPTLSEIEVKWRASGSGVCVIVEGETELEDAWFYNTWFGDRARQVTFFPQDGWERVITAVASLRNGLGAKKVYGIIDRDFVDPTYDPFPANGILRTHKYTLENYLLDPQCWFEIVYPFTRREPKPGWSTEAEVQATIESLYRECIPISAYNWTLRQARTLDYAAFTYLPDKERAYARHPKALENWGDVPAHLRDIQARMGLPDDLGRLYADRLAAWQSLSLADLEKVVTGKAVLTLLRERFPLRLSGSRAWDDMLGAYVNTCPDPPADLKTLVDLILGDAHL
jgi:hypothetical protein